MSTHQSSTEFNKALDYVIVFHSLAFKKTLINLKVTNGNIAKNTKKSYLLFFK